MSKKTFTKKQLNDIEKQIRKQERELKKLEKENAKQLAQIKKLEKQQIKASVKSSKSYKSSKPVKKIVKSSKKIVKSSKKIEKEDKDVCIDVKLYAKKSQKRGIMNGEIVDIITKTYNNHEIEQYEGSNYIVVFKLSTIIKENKIRQYELDYFYNDLNTIEDSTFIGIFLKTIMDNDETIDKILKNYLVSKDISGFKIVIKNPVEENEDYDIINAKLKNDEEQVGINTEYTNYIVDLNSKSFNDLLVLEYNDYLKANFRPRSCLLTNVIQCCYNRFNRIKANGMRRNKELTYEYLCEMMKLENKSSDIECSIKELMRFISKFNFIGLSVFTPFMRRVFHHQPEEKNDFVMIKLIIQGSHVYLMNDKLDKLSHKSQSLNNDDEENEKMKLEISNQYKILKPRDNKIYFVKSINELLETIKNICKKEENNDEKNEDEENTIVAKIPEFTIDNEEEMETYHLNHILHQIIISGYIPKIQCVNRYINKIMLYFNNKNIIIVPACENIEYGVHVSYKDLEEYSKYNTEFNKFYADVCREEFISECNDDTLEFEKNYKITPLLGYIKKSKSKIDGLDENKAYTECLKSIYQIPVFNYFDVYKTYKGEKIEDLTCYFIQVLENSIEASICFNSKFTRTYGYVLKNINIKYKIIAYRKPLEIKETNFEQAVENLFSIENFKNENKKSISNIVSGLLEKNKNKITLNKIFTTYSEAKFYRDKYENSNIIELNIDTNFRKEKVYNEIDDIEEIKTINDTIKYYLVSISEKRDLTNGLVPIKELIYQNQRLKLLKLYKKLKSLNIPILGFKTDCIFYPQEYTKIILKSNFPLSNKIGDFKIEIDKELVDTKLELIMNEYIEIPKYEHTIKQFENEYDTEKINKFINETTPRRILIKGEFPGVGKSNLAKAYDKSALFICPYNKLCQTMNEQNFDSITYSKCFGLFCDDIEIKQLKCFSIDDYKTIVFDEAFLYTPLRLKRIALLMNKYPEKTFIATGDTLQRDPIGFVDSEYLDECMNIMFPNQIILKEIKRLKNEKDKEIWKGLKRDIFDMSQSIESIIKKYNINTIYKMSDVKTIKNIALFNFRCDAINNHVKVNILKEKCLYKEGLEIVKNGTYYKGKYKFCTNYTYKIINVGKLGVKIIDELKKMEYSITNQELIKYFKLPYCLTIDSVQGISFGEDEKITIFDSNLPYVNRKFLWTGITRARKIENISVYIHSKSEVERLTESRIKQYFNFKINSYKNQDKIKNRTWEECEYVNHDWLIEKIDKSNMICSGCQKYLEINLDENNDVESNITIDRIDNTKAHIQKNCQILCFTCNITKGNRMNKLF